MGLSMTQRVADVFYKEELAGRLEETAGAGSRFTYSGGWATPIACCLPVSRREHEWEQGLHPFFQHLGPEGWLRERQARAGRVAEQDDFGLLLRYGGDCIGAVSIQPARDLASAPGETISEQTANPRRTISGIQRKLLVVQEGKSFRAAGPTGPAPFIAKFNSERIPTLVRNENLSMRWARAVLAEDEVCGIALGHVIDLDETALIVTRFDRTADGGKLRLEDFAQILAKPRGIDFAGKYGGSYEDVGGVIREHSARPTIDLARFFRRLVLFALIGNCDAHLKNFSLLETPTGLRLSPAYDILNTAIYEGYDQYLALTISGDRVHLDDVTRALLVRFGRSIGLPQSALDQTFQDLRRRVRHAAPILRPPDAEAPEGFITRFAEIVTRACQRLLDE
jgi:serine/threonine-protein kinase HipA